MVLRKVGWIWCMFVFWSLCHNKVEQSWVIPLVVIAMPEISVIANIIILLSSSEPIVLHWLQHCDLTPYDWPWTLGPLPRPIFIVDKPICRTAFICFFCYHHIHSLVPSKITNTGTVVSIVMAAKHNSQVQHPSSWRHYHCHYHTFYHLLSW